MSKGVISYVEQHPEWKTYSFQLSGDRTYYRAGKFFKFKEGDSVEFDTEVVGRNTRASKIRSWDAPPVQSGTPATAVAASTGAKTSNDYWAAREARDIDVQKRIELQSCRNSALEIVKVLVSEPVGGVKLPAKQADKTRVVEELVAHYTELFLVENKNGSPGPHIETPEIIPASAEAVVEKQEEKTNDDDNWS